MSYVGNKPALNYVNLAVQHFTTSATASYTLNQSEFSDPVNDVVPKLPLPKFNFAELDQALCPSV